MGGSWFMVDAINYKQLLYKVAITFVYALKNRYVRTAIANRVVWRIYCFISLHSSKLCLSQQNAAIRAMQKPLKSFYWCVPETLLGSFLTSNYCTKLDCRHACRKLSVCFPSSVNKHSSGAYSFIRGGNHCRKTCLLISAYTFPQ